jgi:outer membrane lipoprotein-sorting protein
LKSIVLIVAFLTVPLSAADPLPDILARMDQNAAKFQSVSGNLQRISHNAAVDVDHTASGTILLKRSKPHEMRALINFTQPDPQQILVSGTTAQIYYPKIETVQEYDLGKHKELFDQFYLLGFGGSGKELVDAYDIKYLGQEDIGGAKTSHLQLVPKSREALKSVRKVDLWLSEATAYTSQLRIEVPSGDTTTLVYSNLKVNPNVPDSALKLKLPKGVHIVRPGK